MASEGSPSPADPVAPVVPEQPDLSFIPTDYHTDGKPDFGKFTSHYQELVARDAQYAERMAEVPADGAYDFALPADLKYDGLDLPEDFAVNLRTDDPDMAPLFGEMGELLKSLGAPKGAAAQASSLIAKYEATKCAIALKAQRADAATLGAPAQQQARIANISRALESCLPTEQAEAIKRATLSSAGVKALEALLLPRGFQTPTPSPVEELDGEAALRARYPKSAAR